MVKNDCGVYISGTEKVELDNNSNFVKITIGEESGKFGYALNIQGKTSGFCYGLADRDLKYASRVEMLNHMRLEVFTGIIRHCDNDEILKDKFLDTFFNDQLELF